MSNLTQELNRQWNNPARLNKRVELLRDASLTNTVGGRQTEGLSSDEAYQPYATVWANITPISARESFESNRSVVEVTHEVVMRYRKDIHRDHMLRYNKRLFRIEHMLNMDEVNRFLQLSVTEET